MLAEFQEERNYQRKEKRDHGGHGVFHGVTRRNGEKSSRRGAEIAEGAKEEGKQRRITSRIRVNSILEKTCIIFRIEYFSIFFFI